MSFFREISIFVKNLICRSFACHLPERTARDRYHTACDTCQTRVLCGIFGLRGGFTPQNALFCTICHGAGASSQSRHDCPTASGGGFVRNAASSSLSIARTRPPFVRVNTGEGVTVAAGGGGLSDIDA